MRESVSKGADVDICEERETLDVISRVIRHLHIALTDCLALDTTEVNNIFLGVFCRRGRVIQVHSHTLLLRTSGGEGVDGSWLRHLRGAFENLFSTLVDSGNTDDKVAMPHSGVFDLDCELISGENHSDKIDIAAVDTNEFTID